MNSASSHACPAKPLRILIGGAIEDFVGRFIAEVAGERFDYTDTTVQIIHDLQPFLAAATQSPPDLLFVYLYFGELSDETLENHAAGHAAIVAQLAEAGERPCSITACGLRLVPYLRSEFKIPVIVLTGSRRRLGRASRVEQAGAAALLPVPFIDEECAAALATCLERNP